MASWGAASKLSLTSVCRDSPALILSSAVQNQPGKPWLPITWVGIGGKGAVTRCCLSEGPALGNGGAAAGGCWTQVRGAPDVSTGSPWRVTSGICWRNASDGARYDRTNRHAGSLLGHSWVDRRARAEHRALRRQYLLRRGTGFRRHGDHP